MSPELLEDVWRRHGEELLRFLEARVPPDGDAEDVLHDVLIKALRTERPVADTRGWVFQVAKNSLVDASRRGRTAPLSEPEAAEEAFIDDVHRRLVRCVRPFIDRLPEPDRDILVRVDLEGASQLDLAHELSLSHSAVKSRVQRARDRLAELFRRCCSFERDARGGIVDYTCRATDCRSDED